MTTSLITAVPCWPGSGLTWMVRFVPLPPRVRLAFGTSELFDEVAERAEEWVDELAERVTALGGFATGTVRMAASSSTLPEFPTDITDGMAYVRAVAERVAAERRAAAERLAAEEQRVLHDDLGGRVGGR